MNPDARVTDLLDRFEAPTEPFRESAVQDDLNKLGAELRAVGSDFPPCLQAEGLAFHLVENCAGRDGLWGTYYGPQAIGTNAAGERVDIPSLASVTSEVVDYWEQRAHAAKNPVLRSRYADLVWDFSKSVRGKTADVEMARILIDGILATVKKRLHASDGIIPIRLGRAMSVALSIGDTTRISEVRRPALAERRHGYWSAWEKLYALIVWNKRSGIEPDEEAALVADLKAELDAEAKSEKPNQIQVENLALWLADHYRRKNDDAQMRSSLKSYADFILDGLDDAPALAASGRLQRLHDIYQHYNLTSEANDLLTRLEDISKRSLDEMHVYSHPMKISKQELENYLSSLMAGSAEEALNKIAVEFTENANNIRRQMDELSKVAVLQFMAKQRIVDENGIPVAETGSLEDDPDGRLISQMSLNMQLGDMFLHAALERFFAVHNLTPEALCDHVFKSPVFEPARREFILEGLQAYSAQKYTVAIHLLVPQIEAAVRHLARLTGASVYRAGRRGGFQLRNLDELLKLDECKNALGENPAVYLRVLLTDQRGWNVRNNVSHGLVRPESLNVVIADRVLHALLLLALLRKKEE